MNEQLTNLLKALGQATAFQQAAELTCEAVITAARDALAKSAYAGEGKILRVLVHLRPDDGYRELYSSETGVEPKPRSLPSMTAWRFIAAHGCAVSIDVNLGQIEPDSSSLEMVFEDLEETSGKTKRRLLERDATHVYILPLRDLGGAAHGMIALEAECKSAIGKVFIWSECAQQLQQISALAAPYLCHLPRAAIASSHETDSLLPVVGVSMAELIRILSVFAQQEETLLLSGPTGAGKSRLARWCHGKSPRCDAPFETLDLATIPEELQMAELFGWKKGAFTGAVKSTAGAIQRAEGGTLFIDEVDKLSMRAQAGLLHVLEERTYRALGDDGQERRADIRFIVGTNASLRKSVRAGHFREDLYYRINVLPVKIPKLADRPDEIPLWARYMLERHHSGSSRTEVVHLAEEAEGLLSAHPWPGNLRQLDNIVRRAHTIATMAASEQSLVITKNHIAHALAYEEDDLEEDSTDDLLGRMHSAATAFVKEVKRNPRLTLDFSEAFSGFVLGAAAEMTEDTAKAFQLLGKEGTVKSRNHGRIFRREIEKVEMLCQLLGTRSPFSSDD